MSECLVQIDAAVLVRNRNAVYPPPRGTAIPGGSTNTSLELEDGAQMSQYPRKEECKSF